MRALGRCRRLLASPAWFRADGSPDLATTLGGNRSRWQRSVCRHRSASGVRARSPGTSGVPDNAALKAKLGSRPSRPDRDPRRHRPVQPDEDLLRHRDDAAQGACGSRAATAFAASCPGSRTSAPTIGSASSSSARTADPRWRFDLVRGQSASSLSTAAAFLRSTGPAPTASNARRLHRRRRHARRSRRTYVKRIRGGFRVCCRWAWGSALRGAASGSSARSKARSGTSIVSSTSRPTISRCATRRARERERLLLAPNYPLDAEPRLWRRDRRGASRGSELAVEAAHAGDASLRCTRLRGRRGGAAASARSVFRRDRHAGRPSS